MARSGSCDTRGAPCTGSHPAPVPCEGCPSWLARAPTCTQTSCPCRLWWFWRSLCPHRKTAARHRRPSSATAHRECPCYRRNCVRKCAFVAIPSCSSLQLPIQHHSCSHLFNCPSNIIPAVISSIAHPTSFLQSSLQLPIQHHSCSHLFNCPSNIILAVISSTAHPTSFLQSSLQLPIQHHSCSHLFNCPSNIILAVISSTAHPTFSQSSIIFPVQQGFCWCTETKLSRPARHW